MFDILKAPEENGSYDWVKKIGRISRGEEDYRTIEILEDFL